MWWGMTAAIVVVAAVGLVRADGRDHEDQGKVIVDPHSREVFAYQAQIVPKNCVAVPAP